MAPDGTTVVQFNKGAEMKEPVVYAKDVEDFTRWGHWIVITHPVECAKTENIIECQKHITVDPQASLSLQIHKGREEIYKGLEGTTKVCVNGEVFDLKPSEELFLHRGALHFSWNADTEKSKFHEIQQGPLCDENDIFRSADKYKTPDKLNSDDDVIQMMISVCKDRYDAGDRVVYDYGSKNPHMERLANADLLNIYIMHKDDSKKLWSEMDNVLQKCKRLHFQETPVPKNAPQHVQAIGS